MIKYLRKNKALKGFNFLKAIKKVKTRKRVSLKKKRKMKTRINNHIKIVSR